MIDSLIYFEPMAAKSPILKKMGLQPRTYGVITLHRPSNVDNKENFLKLLNAFEVIEKKIPLIFPIHPRSQKMIDQLGLREKVEKMHNLRLTEPLGYLDFMRLLHNAKLVLTDSGGIQEETTYLGISCITMRENTERPITVEVGTNVLVGTDTELIIEEAQKVLDGKGKNGDIPPLWDGKAAERIIRILNENL